MANTHVTLLWRCKTPNGWRRYPATFASNGKPRPGVVIIDGSETQIPTGRFELRYYSGRRQMFKDAGTNSREALVALDRATAELLTKACADFAGLVVLDDAPERKGLRKEFRLFLNDVEGRGKLEASQIYELVIPEFLECAGKAYADELTREDLTRYQKKLRSAGYSDRTIYNRSVNICAFLRWLEVDVKKLLPRMPQYEETLPEVYSTEETTRFFAAVKDLRLALAFELMLKCGLREQETVYLEWSAVDFAGGKLRVRANPRFDFEVKDKEQRDIPIEPLLLEHLKTVKAKYPSHRLVASTKNDKPNLHLLRTLKHLVNDAGLQCGSCDGCLRERNPECERWFLHKFRATFITRLLRGGMDLRTVMKYSGHSDLDSVMRYLSPADDEVARKIVDSVKWI